MFTSIDKAIIGAIMGLIFILSSQGVAIPEFLNETWVTSVVGVLTPVLVYFVPNKGSNNAKT
jgi:hypothetical protein